MMIGQAKKFDESAGGFPVMQTLVKAFLLRGNGDSIKDQIAQSYNRKYALEQEAGELESKIASLQARIDGHKAEAAYLKKEQGLDAQEAAEDAELTAMGAQA